MLILLFLLIFTGFLDNISVSRKTIVTLIALHYFSVKLAVCQGFEGLSLCICKKVHTFWNVILERNKRKQKNAFCLRGLQQPLWVSWLKIEPWSRFSPAIEAYLGFYCFRYKKIFLLSFILYLRFFTD